MRRTAAAAWVMALALALAALIGLCRAQQDTVTHPGSLLREWRLDKSFFSRRDRLAQANEGIEAVRFKSDYTCTCAGGGFGQWQLIGKEKEKKKAGFRIIPDHDVLILDIVKGRGKRQYKLTYEIPCTSGRFSEGTVKFKQDEGRIYWSAVRTLTGETTMPPPSYGKKVGQRYEVGRFKVDVKSGLSPALDSSMLPMR